MKYRWFFIHFYMLNSYISREKHNCITDPKGYLYQRSYDKDDRLIGTKNPLSETEKYTYDAGSRLTAFTDRMKLTEHYTWGGHNNLTSKTATGGEKLNYNLHTDEDWKGFRQRRQ